jgi:hypothetical protein
MVMIYYEDHSFSSSQADDMDERRSTISVSPEVSADEKPFSFFDLLCYADKIDWFLMALGTIGSIILLGTIYPCQSFELRFCWSTTVFNLRRFFLLVA